MYFISGYAGFYCPRYSIVHCWCWTWKDVWEKAWIQGSREPGADSSGKSTWIQGSGEPGTDSLGKYMDTRESGADSPCKVHR